MTIRQEQQTTRSTTESTPHQQYVVVMGLEGSDGGGPSHCFLAIPDVDDNNRRASQAREGMILNGGEHHAPALA